MSASDIINHNINDFFPDALVEKVRKSKKAEENTSHYPRKGSHIFASARPLYINGKFCGAVSSDRDHAEVTHLYAELENVESRMLFLETELKAISDQGSNFIGSTPNIVKLRELVRQIAPSNTSVMITGESGTGKEVFARKIHKLSAREGLFVPINCSAIPSELFESEFFGYSPGAFTGASRKGEKGAISSWPTRERSSWMKLAICRCTCRQSCCAPCRNANFSVWADKSP